MNGKADIPALVKAVLSMEQSRAGMRDHPGHRATLPFTRMLTGMMVTPPGGFDNAAKADFAVRSRHVMVMGTRRNADRYPKGVSVRKQTVDRNTRLKAQLAPGGGYAARFVPLR